MLTTWRNHFLIAAALMVPGLAWAWEWAACVTWGYLFRELDQLRHLFKYRRLGQVTALGWLDHVMDVVSPAVAAFGIAWLVNRL